MLARISKAIAGGIASGVSALVGVWPDGITAVEWGTVAAAAVVGGLAVWAAPANAPKAGYALVPVSQVTSGGPRLR